MKKKKEENIACVPMFKKLLRTSIICYNRLFSFKNESSFFK